MVGRTSMWEVRMTDDASEIERRKAIVEHVVGPVNWLPDGSGYFPCPGREFHSTRSGDRDCKVFVEGMTVSVYCFHAHCEPYNKDTHSQSRPLPRVAVKCGQL